MIHLGDITKINGASVPPVDVVTGGSPCQDLSVAGKRAGLDGERSGLFMEQIRIVKEMRANDRNIRGADALPRPRFMVWENVPGAFSSNKGEDFRVVLEEIVKIVDQDAVIPEPPKGKWANAGCIMGDRWSVAWRVHDAQFWGVPQRRRRIALVADFGGLAAPEILFERESVSGDSEPSGEARERTPGSSEGSADSAICLQGNGIDRSDTAGCNGRGWRRGGAYTLNTIDRPAVYDEDPSRVRGGGKGPLIQTDKSGTLGTGNDQTLFVDVYNQTMSGDVAPTMSAAVGGANTTGPKLIAAGFKAGQSRAGGIGFEEERAATLLANCSGTEPTILTGGIASVDCRNGTINERVSGTLQAKERGTSVNLNNTVLSF